MPAFWSIQFGVNIKSVGVPPFADEIQFTQGSKADRNPVAAYGRDGRVVAAVFFDQAKWLDFYRRRSSPPHRSRSICRRSTTQHLGGPSP